MAALRGGVGGVERDRDRIFILIAWFCLEKRPRPRLVSAEDFFGWGGCDCCECTGGGDGGVVVAVGDLEFEQSAKNCFVFAAGDLAGFLVGGDGIVVVLLFSEQLSVADGG